jgi:hypothetical protein
MRQLLTLLLSVGALVLVPDPAVLAAQQTSASDTGAASIAENTASQRVEQAQRELQKIADLVAAGALPRMRLEEAQLNLEDARDEVVLDRTLYAGYAEQTSPGQSEEMIAAAQRRVDREQARIDRMNQIIGAGVASESSLVPLQEELGLRQTSLDLAKLHAHLLEEAAATKATAPKFTEIPEPVIEDFTQGMEHYEGDAGFNESRDLAPIELAFESRFARALPISANGETDVHRALGFDHRGRVDVAVDPNQPEGIWLRQYLKIHRIPYYAFTHAIPGKATAAHIHIGPGSTRLIATRLLNHRKKRSSIRLASRLGPHARNAD